MSLFVEQLATQGLLFFITLGQTFYHTFTKKQIVPAEKEELTLWGYYSLSTEPYIEEQIVYAPSEITMEQDQFFQSFLQPIVNSTQEDCIMNAPSEPIEDDMLTMDAWNDEPAPVEVSKRLAAKADTRISEHKIGEQLWVVEVVGEEQGYIHVSDGSGRAWVETIAYGCFGKGDILSILVDRTIQNQVFAKAVDVLQKKSLEFAIEEHLFNEKEFYEEYSTVAS